MKAGPEVRTTATHQNLDPSLKEEIWMRDTFLAMNPLGVEGKCYHRIALRMFARIPDRIIVKP